MDTLRNDREPPITTRKVEFVARDIDDWMFHFEQQARSRLRELFELNLEGLPPALASRLQKLQAEEHPLAHDCNAKEVPPHKR
jgi:hypothetical protein